MEHLNCKVILLRKAGQCGQNMFQYFDIVDTGCYFNSSQLTDMSHRELFICLWFD